MAQNYDDNASAWGNPTDSDVAKIKNNFAALKSTFSGASQPPNPVAGMWWYDTAANILKLRNKTNTAWLNVWDFANNKPIIANNTLADFNAALKSPAAGTEGFRKLGTGATEAMPGNTPLITEDGSVTNIKLAPYTAGNYLLIGSDNQVTTTSVTPTPLKQFRVVRSGTLRIKYNVLITPAGGYARIYRNGTPVGILRSVSGEYTEDIGGWNPYDLCQIYVWLEKPSQYGNSVTHFGLYSGVIFREQ